MFLTITIAHFRLIAKAVVALQDIEGVIPTSFPHERHVAVHDREIHDPLGAGSYVFQKSFVPSIIRSAGLPIPSDHTSIACTPQKLTVHIGAQPNNSPHAGTMVVFFMGFLVAKEIQLHYKNLSRDGLSQDFCDWIDNFQVKVQLNLVDTAPDSRIESAEGVYQRSLRFTQGVRRYEADYDEVLRLASQGVQKTIEYEITHQVDLTGMECFPAVVKQVVKNRAVLGPLLAPDRGVLAMRAACPKVGCGLADKHGVLNEYMVHPSGEVTISFLCPEHGRYEISTSNHEQLARLEFNTPLRNLVRSIALALDTAQSRKGVMEGKEGACERVHIRVTGSDYAGFYSDQVFWQAWLMLGLTKELTPPVVLYAPLVVDWAGSKISKSLYVKSGAYKYLEEREMNYLLEYATMKKRAKDPMVLFRLVESWVKEPKKIFRSFSVEYLHMVFCEQEARDVTKKKVILALQ